MPSASGVVNTFLPAIGAGQDGVLPGPFLLAQQTTPFSKNDENALESNALFSLVIPKNSLGPNSALEISLLWSVPNSAAAKRLRGRFGGVVLWNFDLTTNLALPWRFVLANRNSMSAQIATPNNSTCFGPVSSVGAQTFAIDFATDQTLTITAQWPVAGSGSNNITLEYARVEHFYRG